MCNLFRKKNREKGSVSIEASIALTAFLFMFLMIYDIIAICRAQAQIQIAINATAKEISQYSYIYGLSGLDASLAGFQKKGEESKDQVNGFVGNVADMFEGIQSLGETTSSLDIGDVDTLMKTLEDASADLDTIKENYAQTKETIESVAQNPQALLLGMAKLIGSEALEIGKSRLIAEPVCRALVQKHLKRTASDTADAFCKSIRIQPGTYLGTTNYFNGLDFSNSTLFPYGSDEITIIVTYKVKLMELLGIDSEFTITQSAMTKGWLHGDQTSISASSAEEKVAKMLANNESIWNAATLNERVDLIRSMGIDDLKDNGYYGVSGQTHIQAYDPATNSFAMISSANPLYGITSFDDIDKNAVKENISRLNAQMNSATDNIQTIKIKKIDSNGNLITQELSCSGTKNKKVILVIPEDEGLKKIYEDAIKELDTDVEFEIVQSYGTALVEEKTEGEEENKGGDS